METRANYILIGLFTLATVMGAFGFVYWFHHVGGTGERVTYRVMFQGPIGGLRSGASVTFNGIRVGEVTELTLDPKEPKNSVAVISVDATTPVRADTEVSLDSQGLTGIAVLALRGGAADAGPVTAKMNDTPLLTAGTSASQDMMAAARDVARRIDAVLVENQQTLKNSLKHIETFTEMLSKNSDSLSKSVKNIETFTDALAKNSEKVDRVLVSADKVLGNVESLTAEKGDVPEAVRAFKTLAENLDKRLEGLVVDGRRTLNTIDRAVRNFDENPSRIIFGGGRPATQAPRRQQ
ncbi:MlaD family protein [Pseudorhodoplanes sp.]|uniref:MlaD family protein n=1 Tax=Pseudorhodoplanes sp. TaxID=1934341 RepID=UPI002CD74C34|nr:MlaD family protein [Pseudorhodoplanes sp.]HWV53278.1 MlaD family protein [Pseudorhodoplanes sp.]